jgi:hypothetical protein
VALMKSLGIKHYRMSFSWSRLVPDGQIGTTNPAGVSFYNSLINELLANGITVYGTLYHWDMPQRLQASGAAWLRGKMLAPAAAGAAARASLSCTQAAARPSPCALPQSDYNGFQDKRIVEDFKWCAARSSAACLRTCACLSAQQLLHAAAGTKLGAAAPAHQLQPPPVFARQGAQQQPPSPAARSEHDCWRPQVRRLGI